MHARITLAVISLATLLALPAWAQKFQEPTQEELRMTADPMFPGTPAVFLYRDEATDNFAHYVSCYARIKILTELGKEWATVEVPYVPGYEGRPIIEGRTIHPDGSVYPLALSENDLVAGQHAAIQMHKIVFNLPNVTVGSILEYRWTRPMTGTDLRFFDKLGDADRKEALAGLGSSQLAWETPAWDVQQKIPIRKAHFYYNPLNDLDRNVIGGLVDRYVDGERASYIVFTQHLPAGSTVTKAPAPKLDFTLDIQNVPPIREESNAPPLDATRYRVNFYWTPYITAADYWEGEQKRWSKKVDEFASPDKLRAVAADLTAGAATPEAKARKLYDAVQSLENTDFTHNRSAAERFQMHAQPEKKKAEEIWTEKSGTSDQIASLYLALARAAGLDAYAMQVADRNLRVFDPNFLSLYQLDSVLVVLRLDGKDIYLDPGQKFCPFGQLSWTHLLVGGLSQATKVPTYTPPNLSKDAITAHAADLTLSADGSVTGTVKVLMNGPAATNWRQLALRMGTEELKLQFTAAMRSIFPQGINASVEKFDGLETSSGYLSATMNVSGMLGSPTGKRLIVPAFFFSAASHPEFVSEDKRESAVDLKFAEQVIDDVVYHLPAGFSVQSAPAPAQLPWPEHAALVVKTQTSAGTIDIKHIFARAFVILDPKDYPGLRDYYQKVAASNQQQLLLTGDIASAGN